MTIVKNAWYLLSPKYTRCLYSIIKITFLVLARHRFSWMQIWFSRNIKDTELGLFLGGLISGCSHVIEKYWGFHVLHVKETKAGMLSTRVMLLIDPYYLLSIAVEGDDLHFDTASVLRVSTSSALVCHCTFVQIFFFSHEKKSLAYPRYTYLNSFYWFDECYYYYCVYWCFIVFHCVHVLLVCVLLTGCFFINHVLGITVRPFLITISVQNDHLCRKRIRWDYFSLCNCCY